MASFGISLLRIFLVIGFALCASVSTATERNESRGGAILLTFDVELDPDADALKSLQLDVPATYFFTGLYAERYPELLRELAQGPNSIGSHSFYHDHLTQVTDKHLRMDLELSKLAIENISGRKLTWFRAPYLEYNDAVMRQLVDLGFAQDSSDIDAWLKNKFLPELGIAYHRGRLVSDYDIFEADKLSDAEALEWLIEAYDAYALAGRPFVFLMHPRIIGAHPEVLHALIDHVRESGGRFLSVDDYAAEVRDGKRDRRIGMWVDLSFEDIDTTTLVTDARSLGVTDVYLSALDPAGISYLPDGPEPRAARPKFDQILKALKATGIRVHGWVAVNSNVALATARPDLAMINADGAPSYQWISPSRPEVRQYLHRVAQQLMQGRDLDGLHLDYVRYPDLAHDFSPDALRRFQTATGIATTQPNDLLADHFQEWVSWRTREIEGLVAEIADRFRTEHGPNLELSAALIADAAVNYRSKEKFGQDYARLAKPLDRIIPMAYYPLEQRTPDWVERVLFTASSQAGNTPLLTGLASYQKPGEWSIGADDIKQGLDHAATYTDGAVFYPYSGLFGRRTDDANVSPDVLAAVRETLGAWHPASSLSEIFGFLPTGSALGWTIVAALAALSSLLAFRSWLRKRRLHGVVSEAEHGLHSDADPPRGWQDLSVRMREGVIDWPTCRDVARLLRSFGPAKIDDLRIHHALYHASGRHHSETGAEPHRRALGRTLADARVLGWVELKAGRWSLTQAGDRALSGAIKQGFEPALYDFIENRLEEHLSADCESCGTANAFSYFWPAFDCRECGKEVQASDCAELRVVRPGKTVEPAAVQSLETHRLA